MDFDDSPAEAKFRSEAQQWLGDHAQLRDREAASLTIFEHRDSGEEDAWVSACREWQATKYRGGYAAISWPSAWGGRDGTNMEEIIFSQEEDHFSVATGAFGITMVMIAATILTHGTDEQKSHVPRMLSGEEVWCQLFSEPSAGSDLASLRTRAVLEGDVWRVNGQKVWTSGAHYADWGYIICRSNTSVPKHKGLTAFILPMDTEGVTVSRLRQMTGGSNFNEVFFDDVRVPDSNRLGPEGAGWRVAITTLMRERISVGSVDPSLDALDALVQLARTRELDCDPLARQRLAELHILMEIHRYSKYRTLTAISNGSEPGPEGSIGKLTIGRILRAMSDVGVSLAGPAGVLENQWSQLLLGSPGLRLGGGTEEIMRNILAERVLGLPSEPRVDRDVPFDELVS